MLLLSGGIDSPVAGYYAMRRGLRLECLHFHSPPWTGSAVTRKIDDLLGVLRRYDPSIVLHVADFTAVQEFIRDQAPEDHRVVMYRRAMFRISSSLGRARGLAAIVTGENLGQVASQTLANMACIEKAASLPVIRPLVTFDKADTIRCARSIGTFPISTRRAEDCCSLFVPEHPVTRAQASLCLEVDARLEKSGLLARCLDGIVTTP
jgi:thiamine biosynthesis protein ThiI